MSLTRDTKAAIALGVIGAAIGYSMLLLNVRHNFESGPVVLMTLGAFLIVLSPLAALLWAIQRKRKLQLRRSYIACSFVMLIGILGPTPFEPLVPYRFGDIFGLLFWGGLLALVSLMIYRWLEDRREPKPEP